MVKTTNCARPYSRTRLMRGLMPCAGSGTGTGSWRAPRARCAASLVLGGHAVRAPVVDAGSGILPDDPSRRPVLTRRRRDPASRCVGSAVRRAQRGVARGQRPLAEGGRLQQRQLNVRLGPNGLQQPPRALQGDNVRVRAEDRRPGAVTMERAADPHRGRQPVDDIFVSEAAPTWVGRVAAHVEDVRVGRDLVGGELRPQVVRHLPSVGSRWNVVRHMRVMQESEGYVWAVWFWGGSTVESSSRISAASSRRATMSR